MLRNTYCKDRIILWLISGLQQGLRANKQYNILRFGEQHDAASCPVGSHSTGLPSGSGASGKDDAYEAPEHPRTLCVYQLTVQSSCVRRLWSMQQSAIFFSDETTSAPFGEKERSRI